jgi:hypothetical protein
VEAIEESCMRRAFVAVIGAALAASGIAAGGNAPAAAAPVVERATHVEQAAPAFAARKTASSRVLLRRLDTASERRAGYVRSKFRHWVDVDRDGCDTREEVLIAEARSKPTVGAGCSIRGGSWLSVYDGKTISNSSALDIDHLVPLAEAWDSGARKWNAGTRTRFANDLKYGASLIAVSASTNRSKGDRDPAEWMPPNTGVHCAYAAQWTAVKSRWKLTVDRAERRALKRTLRDCGWPKVATPTAAKIKHGSSRGGGGSSTGSSSSGGGGGTTVPGTVHPGAFCAPEGAYGYTSAGTRMRCTRKVGESQPRWRSA